MKRNRALLALLPAALIGGLLTSCSSDSDTSNSDDASGANCVAAGAASDAVQIDGDLGGTLTLTAGTPVSAEQLQRTVLIEGDGRELVDGDAIRSQMTFFNGATGELIDSGPNDLTIDEAQLNPWAYQAVSCASVGDRVVIAAPVVEIAGEGNAAQLGLEETDTLVLVLDMLGAQAGTLDSSELLPKAEGESQQAPAGLPQVELDGDGAPTITMPTDAEPPTSLTVATLIKGDGEEVRDGDRVYVHYRGVIWRTGEEFDSSWSRGEATAFTTDGVIRGFEEALVGQTVGSQVISVVPAEDGGYGASWLTGQGYEADDVMVFVLDILGTVHAE